MWAAGAIVVVGAAYLLKPGPVRSTLRHPEALARIGALVVAWVGLGWVVRRLLSGRTAAQRLVMAVPAAALVWMLVVPYATDKTVVEAFPVSVAGGIAEAPDADAAAGPAPALGSTTTAPAPAAAGPSRPGPTTTMPAPPAPAAGAPAPVAPAPVAEPVAPDASTPPPDASAPAPEDRAEAPAAPVALGAGAFVGIDHRAVGDVALYRLADGAVVVRLENVDIEPGPDYDLYLVAGAGRQNPDGGVRLDDLKGNKGDQNYPVPAGVPVDGELTVLVWCEAFSVPVAAATLS